MSNDDITYDDFERMQFCSQSEGTSALEQVEQDEPISFEEVLSEIENCCNIDNELDSSLLINLSNGEPSSSSNPNNTSSASSITTSSIIENKSTIELELCNHESCNYLDLKAIAAGFHKMNMNDRINFVRAMLFSLSSKSCENEIMKEITTKTRKRRRRISEVDDTEMENDKQCNESNVYTAFVIHGRRICSKSFCAVVGLSKNTILNHASSVLSCIEPSVYSSSLSKSRKGKWGIQRVIVKAFLISMANNYGLECPRGSGSKDESPIRILLSNFTKKLVFDMYIIQWNNLAVAVAELVQNFEIPESPISYNLFIRYWDEDFSLLRIGKSGSDFCDQCTLLKNELKKYSLTDIRRNALKEKYDRHINEAQKEFLNYKSVMEEAKKSDHTILRHFVFDFTEKVLLPKILNQPGQLHFITGLKVDINGVYSSNTGRADLYGLIEGHWPSNKTANTVLSMLHHTIERRTSCDNVNSHGKKLVLHADNCTGQNKNKYVLFYIIWRALMGFEDEVQLCFLIVGHTKNVCDGFFGHVKRNCLKNDIYTPKAMMDVIQNSSVNTDCISGTMVAWFQWKEMFERYFKVPNGFKISEYHVFKTQRTYPGFLFAKRLSSQYFLRGRTILL